MDLRFPKGFVWGAATASYQIEGSPLAHGAGPSIWHRFSHTPGNVHNGNTGDVACDHYRRWKEDVILMGDLGLRAYRFSIAWPRVFPDGTGSVSEPGLAFYDRLVDALMDAGIEPFATLYHWDLPSALQDRGGWANRDIAGWFADYADAVFRRLGDRVKHWITLNEPMSTTNGAYVVGDKAPGLRDLWGAWRSAHHQLLAHGRAVKAFRDSGNGGEIGITNVTADVRPSSHSVQDRDAAARMHAYINLTFMEPVYKGRYPELLEDYFAEAWPPIGDDDMKVISEPTDFLGLNYYFPMYVTHSPGGFLDAERVHGDGLARTEMDWDVDPRGFANVLAWIRDAYGNPAIYITENGAAFSDEVTPDGEVSDKARVEYLQGHLAALQGSIALGSDVRGYFAWSLMDNFEWAHGYSKRFGLVRVDYETQARTIKQSGRWYQDLIKEAL